MMSKHLAIAAAFVLLTGLSVGQASAQDTQGNQTPAATTATDAGGTPAMASPGGAATTPDAAGTPAPAGDQMAAPAANTPTAADMSAPKQEVANPYGLEAFWKGGDFVIRGVIILLAIMSVGTWYIFFTKYWEQARMLGQAKQVDKRFWSSNNLNEGIDKLAKNSVFRGVAETGVKASNSGGSGIVNVSDWIGMSLNRQLEEINARLQGGISFLASVGSVAPFVGLFGTVWGILNALVAIGIAGQASIDKVAGPVGEALIATAIGLAVAVPAVLLYNFLVSRNKLINEKLRAFASDLQQYLVTNKGK